MSYESTISPKKRLLKAIYIPSLLIILIWAVHLFQYFTTFNFAKYGVLPLSPQGLKGIILSPFIHSGFSHLWSNSIPLFVMGTTLYYFFSRVASQSLLWITLLSGLGTWLIGRYSYHIGASGVVYGLLGFVLFSGLFRQSRQSIIISLLFTALYTGYFAGIAPGEDHVSWEGHLSGVIAGLLVAFAMKNVLEVEEIPEAKPIEEQTFFLPPDVFEKTKWERYQEAQQALQSQWESDSTEDFQETPDN